MVRYVKPLWAVSQTIRESGLVEDVCKHGIGHPNAQWLWRHDPSGRLAFGVHGCDGCCSKAMKKAIKESKEKLK
jgi:hypothetical protein